jgi:hypothetical protein
MVWPRLAPVVQREPGFDLVPIVSQLVHLAAGREHCRGMIRGTSGARRRATALA